MPPPEQDVERGPEMASYNTGAAINQPSLNEPIRTYSVRETQVSPHPMNQPQTGPASVSQYAFGMPQQENPFLSSFRYHVGIHNDPSLSHVPPPPQAQGLGALSVGNILSTLTKSVQSSATTPSTNGVVRPAPNLGIYQRVIIAEQRYQREYKTFSFLINGALGLQIIFAAALTALGAGNGPHTAVTAFGAMNTVLAGLLTFLKGSGLPNRLRYYETSWSKVREYIEQRERDLASECLRNRVTWDDVAAEVAVIEAMYEDVRKDVEANTPESYVSMSNAMKSASTEKPHPASIMGRGLSQGSRKLDAVYESAERTGNNAQDRMRGGVSEAQDRFSKGWGDLEKRATIQVREIGDEFNERASGAGKQVDYHIANTQQSINDGMRQTQNMAESRYNDAQKIAESRYQDAGKQTEASLSAAQLKFSEAQHKLSETQQKISETQHDAEAKFKEMENKISSVAEKAAEKVLEMTKHRHSQQ